MFQKIFGYLCKDSLLCKVNIAEQVCMDQREMTLFLAFYLCLTMHMQSFTQIRALQAQILMLKLLQLYIIILIATPEQLPWSVPLLLQLIVRII